MRYVFVTALLLISPAASTGTALTFDEAVQYFENFETVMSFVRSSEDAKNDLELIVSEIRVESDQSIAALVRKVRENPYRCRYDAPSRELIRRGREVVSYVIDELNQSSSYYRLCLIEILSEISDERVYVSFIDQLRRILDANIGFLHDDMALVLIRTLSRRGYRPLVSVLREYLLADDVPRRVRSEARVALAQMGHVELMPISDDIYSFELKDENEDRRYIELLKTLIGYEVLRYPLELRSVEESESFVHLGGDLCPNSGRWQIKFEASESDFVPFYYTWTVGPLEQSGYIGILEKTSNGWVMVFWKQLWLS